MKKMLVFLLGIAFTRELLLVIYVVGECMSPRQVLYTITDEMMNSVYRFKRGWHLRAMLP